MTHTPRWHLEHAAIQQMLAARHVRHGMYVDAERALAKAQQHRDKAAALDRAKATA